MINICYPPQVGAASNVIYGGAGEAGERCGAFDSVSNSAASDLFRGRGKRRRETTPLFHLVIYVRRVPCGAGSAFTSSVIGLAIGDVLGVAYLSDRVIDEGSDGPGSTINVIIPAAVGFAEITIISRSFAPSDGDWLAPSANEVKEVEASLASAVSV